MKYNLKGVRILVNYKVDEYEANIPSEMSVDQLCQIIKRLFETEPDMTSFIVTAIKRGD